MKRSTVVVLLTFVSGLMTRVAAQTQCSLNVPVPDLSYCDASGILEEHVDANVHETRGRIRAVQDYAQDSFKLFDQQFTVAMKDSTNTDMDIRDVEEEILTLKRVISHLQTIQTNDEIPEVRDGRQKRAATQAPSPSQQSLNAAKTVFQQNLASVMQKLQGISSSITNEVAKSVALHSKLQKELATNQQTLATTERQLHSLDTSIRTAVKATGIKGGNGVSLSAVTQDVTDLVINATVSEQIIQRQLDDLDKLEIQLEHQEQSAASRLSSINTGVNDIGRNVTSDIQQTANLKSAERIYEDLLGALLYNTTRDVADVRAQLGPAQQQLSQVANSVLNTTLALGGFEVDLKAYRKEVDSVQSVVTFTTPLQQAQSGQILRLKKTLVDDINLLKYAFGLRATPP